MARTKRIVFPGCPHHVYVRGNNRRRLISYSSDYYILLRCLSRALDRSSCELHQLTFMTNHYHLEATPEDDASLSRLMHRCNQRYAQIRNPLRSGSGKLFEERFRSKPIRDDKYLQAVTLYNDANAYRAGLVADPFEHSWSTAPIHGGFPERSKIPLELWTPSPWYLALGSTPQERAEHYRALMYEYISRGTPEPVQSPSDSEDSARYTRRLERPDGSSAREGLAAYQVAPPRERIPGPLPHEERRRAGRRTNFEQPRCDRP